MKRRLDKCRVQPIIPGIRWDMVQRLAARIMKRGELPFWRRLTSPRTVCWQAEIEILQLFLFKITQLLRALCLGRIMLTRAGLIISGIRYNTTMMRLVSIRAQSLQRLSSCLARRFGRAFWSILSKFPSRIITPMLRS